MRAVRIFQVTRRGVCVRVRVLPKVGDVDRAYRNGGKARTLADTVNGFTVFRTGSKNISVTLPLDRWTPGLVAHEVVHVAYAVGYTDLVDDEPLATIVGELTDSICKRMGELEDECA